MHNGQFQPILVQKYPDFGITVVKNDQGEPKLCPMSFLSRAALYMREFSSWNKTKVTLVQEPRALAKKGLSIDKARDKHQLSIGQVSAKQPKTEH